MSAAERLRRAMGLDGSVAAVFHNPSNMFWVTDGYTGEGEVFLSGDRQVIITDFRYTEQAGRQAPGFECREVGAARDHNGLVAALCKEAGVTELRCEEDYLTVRAYRGLTEAVESAVPGIRITAVAGAPEAQRMVKTEAEIACIREACRITSRAYDELLGRIREGMTEKELRIELDFLQLKLGAQCNSFDTIVASGENGSLPHAVPGERKLRRGDLITMDFGCKFGGYCSDMTRTVALGEPSAELRAIYDTVFEAQALGVALLGPGKVCSSIDRAVRDVIEAKYPGCFGHSLGHSVGIDIHEGPNLSLRCDAVTEPGHVLTVEPGVYIPGLGGVRIEDTCLVTADGCETLTTAPKALTIL